MTVTWLQFFAAAAAIFAGGFLIVRVGDEIARETGLGRVWAGVVLLASATSLPELITTIGAVTVADSPDLAAGNVFGANLLNMALLAALSLRPAWSGLMTVPRASAALGLSAIALTLAAGGFVLMARLDHGVAARVLGTTPVLLAGGYLLMTYRISRKPGAITRIDPRRILVGFAPRLPRIPGQLVRSLAVYVVGAAIVVASALWLATIADRLAIETGWDESFVGAQFLAVATTLPELAVAIAALRAGSPELAQASWLGSNMFNPGIVLAVGSFVYGPPAFFGSAELVHSLLAGLAAVVTALVIWRPLPAPVFGRKYTAWPMAARALAILAIYGSASAVTFLVSG